MHDDAVEAYLETIDNESYTLGIYGSREHARALEERGASMKVGELGRAEWLRMAGEGWKATGDLASALRCVRAAVQDGGPTYVDARAELVGVLLALGEDVDGLLAELRVDARRGRARGPVHDWVGEFLENHDRPEEALRWFNAGLTRGELEGRADQACLTGHWRVRRTLGLPLDRYDEEFEESRRDDGVPDDDT